MKANCYHDIFDRAMFVIHLICSHHHHSHTLFVGMMFEEGSSIIETTNEFKEYFFIYLRRRKWRFHSQKSAIYHFLNIFMLTSFILTYCMLFVTLSNLNLFICPKILHK